MIAAQLPDTLVAKTNADWIEEPWQFQTAAGASDDFTGCTFGGGVYQNGSLIYPAATYLHLDSATNPAQASWRVPKSVMATAKLGSMTMTVTLVTPSNGEQPLVTGAVRIEAP